VPKIAPVTWLKNPPSKWAKEDTHQTEPIGKARKESGEVYGNRKPHYDLFDQGEMYCPNRVAQLLDIYLAVVIDLYARRVVRWSMQSRQMTDVVLQALPVSVWRAGNRGTAGCVQLHHDCSTIRRERI